MLTKTALNWIDGQWVDTSDHRDSTDPATGEKIGTWACADAATTATAVDAAVRAFADTPWKDDRRLRSRVLNALADNVERHRDELVEALMRENGKVRAEAAFEVGMVPPKLRFWAAAIHTEYGRAAEVRPGQLSLVLREPIGVVGVITPFNSPVILAVRSLAPALAAGNTVVIKFPEQTALLNAVFMRVLADIAELPAGVVNAVTTDREGGNVLVESPDVPVLSFTGSTATGRAIAATAAKHLKRVGLELGGKTPMIVFDGADLEAAAPVLEKAITTFAGQFCMAGSRLLVQRGAAQELRELLADRLAAVTVGPAADPASDMGPLIDKADVERVDRMVRDAIAEGAVPVVRGGPVTEGPLSAGAFYRPTLLEISSPSAEIVRREVFGPVLTLQVFDTEAEAVALANDSDYGLAASVWSRDAHQPLRVARELKAGTVWINNWAVVLDEFEEGGYKQSGQGRLNGLAALDDFTEYKHISFVTGVIDR
ncbi:aldehyde dehydrogenase family protein [Allokutzneria multivorans]|uniref:Aldehyde dehydrogenase family protein n=1 Tax=Allokutzneria multivorans TaxID=1142134 RepID=A0ABP7SEQ3_9PSEU